ncbi:DUF6371 domain-containing protein [Tenacibaculum sp. SSH1-16]|uniref:DUF6371 domain-containing protein n=1 Tax=Tenacibaculum sp. SSH1-16 TaxID=3136667 RepID=UPI0032C468E4
MIYKLEPYNGHKTRYKCPNCKKHKTFTRYINTETNEYLSENVGICNRRIKCNYHYTPKNYFDNNKNLSTPVKNIKKVQLVKKTSKKDNSISYIDESLVIESLNKQKNNFIFFLEKLLGKKETTYLKNLYKIGTSDHWQNSTVFWQIDEKLKVRSGKIMLYNKNSGKRVKTPYNYINWIHKTEKLKNYNLKQCLFGLHLINQNKNLPIGIVESEKTAIIASVYIDQFIWLACGSVNNLNYENTKALKGRNVVLFPDLNCFDLWSKKIKHLFPLANYRVSDVLEKNSSIEEKKSGYDLADYLIHFQRINKELIKRKKENEAYIDSN